MRGLGRRPSDLDTEVLSGAKLRAAGLALHGKGGAEARLAVRTLRTKLAATLGAVPRQLVDELLEVALHEPAGEAEGDPVAQCPAPLLTEPVSRLAHAGDCSQTDR